MTPSPSQTSALCSQDGKLPKAPPRVIRNVFLFSVLLAVLIKGGFFLSDAWLRLSYVDVYQRIEMGMSYKKVQSVLQDERIWCGFVDAAPTGNWPTITFTDYWREYRISFDSKSGLVNRKQFSFRYRQPLSSRLSDIIYTLRVRLHHS